MQYYHCSSCPVVIKANRTSHNFIDATLGIGLRWTDVECIGIEHCARGTGHLDRYENYLASIKVEWKCFWWKIWTIWDLTKINVNKCPQKCSFSLKRSKLEMFVRTIWCYVGFFRRHNTIRCWLFRDYGLKVFQYFCSDRYTMNMFVFCRGHCGKCALYCLKDEQVSGRWQQLFWRLLVKPLFVTNLGCVYAPPVFLAVLPRYVLSQLYVNLTLSPHTACFQLGNIPIFVSDTEVYQALTGRWGGWCINRW